MQIFENPNVVIICFVLGFLLLGGLGIFFAIKGVRTANQHISNDFTSIGKLESTFKKLGRNWGNRSVM